MKLAAVALLSLSAIAAGACSGEEPQARKLSAPSQTFAGLVTFEPPKGWRVAEYANGVDPVMTFSESLELISLRAFGSPGSTYPTQAAFLSGAAASTMGRRPEVHGSVTVAGHPLTLYAHGFPIHLGDPHIPSGGPVTLGQAVFCVLPTSGDRFVVLSFERESPVPDLEGRAERVWETFLKTVEPVGTGR